MKTLVRMTLVCVVLIAVGTLVARAGKQGVPTSTSAKSPPPTTVDTLQSPDVNLNVGVDLEPPPADLSPAVAGDKAAATAWTQEPPEGGASSTEATLALYGEEGKPVWRVRFEGACIQPMGPAPTGNTVAETPSCNTEWNVLIDATSGEFMQAYTDR